MLKIIFEEYQINNKIFAIGFDNASNNTGVITHLITLCNLYFGVQFFHQRCACHVLNLCVSSKNAKCACHVIILRPLEMHFIICGNIHK